MRLVLIAALLLPITASAGNGQALLSAAASDSLSTTTSCEVLEDVAASDANARQMPDGSYMLRLKLSLSSIVTASTVTVWLAESSDGEEAITDQVAETIVDDDADGNGTTNTLVNTGWVNTSIAGNAPYVCAKTGGGTATSIARLTWERR